MKVKKSDIFKFIKLTGAIEELSIGSVLTLEEDDPKATLRTIYIELDTNVNYEKVWQLKVDTRGRRNDDLRLFAFEAKKPETILFTCNIEEKELAILPIEMKSTVDMKKAVNTIKKFEFGIKFALMFSFLNDFQEFTVSIRPILFAGSSLEDDVKSYLNQTHSITLHTSVSFLYVPILKDGISNDSLFFLSDFLNFP